MILLRCIDVICFASRSRLKPRGEIMRLAVFIAHAILSDLREKSLTQYSTPGYDINSRNKQGQKKYA